MVPKLEGNSLLPEKLLSSGSKKKDPCADIKRHARHGFLTLLEPNYSHTGTYTYTYLLLEKGGKSEEWGILGSRTKGQVPPIYDLTR